MTLDIRHIRHARTGNTAWTTIDETMDALIGPGYDNALLLRTDATAPSTDGSDLTSGVVLDGVFRLTHDHRVFFYYLDGATVRYIELIFGFA